MRLKPPPPRPPPRHHLARFLSLLGWARKNLLMGALVAKTLAAGSRWPINAQQRPLGFRRRNLDDAGWRGLAYLVMCLFWSS